MLSRFMPREGNFFELFNQSADLIVEAVYEFEKMLSDLSHAERYSHTIKELEHKADEVTHRTIDLLHSTFITPIDREDIHKLITQMDDILDCLEACSQRVFLYNVTQITEEMPLLADVCIRSSLLIKKAVEGLNDLKHPQEIIKNCVEINRLENEGDQLLRKALVKLFSDVSDTRELIKMKEVCELLEATTDRCEDVANTIEGIVLEYA